MLWSQFGDTGAACRADPKGDDRAITERINELAVAKLLIDDPTVSGPITYEPELSDGRRIDFVIYRGRDSLWQLNDLPDEMWTKTNIEFYKDAADAVFKALVE